MIAIASFPKDIEAQINFTVWKDDQRFLDLIYVQRKVSKIKIATDAEVSNSWKYSILYFPIISVHRFFLRLFISSRIATARI